MSTENKSRINKDRLLAEEAIARERKDAFAWRRTGTQYEGMPGFPQGWVTTQSVGEGWRQQILPMFVDWFIQRK